MARSLSLFPAAIALGIATALPAVAEPTATSADDVEQGRKAYQGCMGCHSLDEDDVGPRHRGVVGRRAGSVPGYVYSPALKASGIVWDAATLDRWLANPQALVPGTKMFFSLSNEQIRADVIAYLATQK
jgi:cytochrome c